MRSWSDSTFVFISTNQNHDEGGVEERWLGVMAELDARGATVRFLSLVNGPVVERARAAGVHVDPYILDRWNVIRSRSRLRKYFKRYVPVAVHSTGLEADLMSRWAARTVPVVRVVHTLPLDSQATRRRRPMDALFRRFDEVGMRRAATVFVPDFELAAEVREAGVAAENVIVDACDSTPAELLERHLSLYVRLMKERGVG